MTPSRTSQLERKTAETQIELRLNLDGTGKNSIRTGVGFLDHMLVLFARHALVDLEVHANGDLEIDAHHTTEDVGICLGQAIRECLGDKVGIRRYGHLVLPMEETLVTSAIDFSGRSYLVFQAPMPSPKIGDFDSELIEDFWQAFASNAQFCSIMAEIPTTSLRVFLRLRRERYGSRLKLILDKQASRVPKEFCRWLDHSAFVRWRRRGCLAGGFWLAARRLEDG